MEVWKWVKEFPIIIYTVFAHSILPLFDKGCVQKWRKRQTVRIHRTYHSLPGMVTSLIKNTFSSTEWLHSLLSPTGLTKDLQVINTDSFFKKLLTVFAYLEMHILVWTDSNKLFKNLKLIAPRELKFYYPLYGFTCRRKFETGLPALWHWHKELRKECGQGVERILLVFRWPPGGKGEETSLYYACSTTLWGLGCSPVLGTLCCCCDMI